MNIKASGRSALILATGLFVVCFAGPSQATAGAGSAAASSKSAGKAPIALNKYAKYGSRHWKSYAHRKSGKLALKSSAASKAAATEVAAAADGDDLSGIPSSVANANAQMADADTPTSNAAKAMSARANDIVQAAPANRQPGSDSQVVSADQLNDIDRALHEGKSPAANMTMASAEAPATPAAASAKASNSGNESSTWDQTSLIGKIFIGFGALLTMASAARMFMA